MTINTITAVGALIGVAAIDLLFPQLIGFISLDWAKGKQAHKALKALLILVAPLVFFAITYGFCALSARAITKSGGYLCGKLGDTALMFIVGGMVLHLVISTIMFLVTNKKAAN